MRNCSARPVKVLMDFLCYNISQSAVHAVSEVIARRNCQQIQNEKKQGCPSHDTVQRRFIVRPDLFYQFHIEDLFYHYTAWTDAAKLCRICEVFSVLRPK